MIYFLSFVSLMIYIVCTKVCTYMCLCVIKHSIPVSLPAGRFRGVRTATIRRQFPDIPSVHHVLCFPTIAECNGNPLFHHIPEVIENGFVT